MFVPIMALSLNVLCGDLYAPDVVIKRLNNLIQEKNSFYVFTTKRLKIAMIV